MENGNAELIDAIIVAMDHIANGVEKSVDAAGHLAGAVGSAAGRFIPEAWNVLVNQQIANGAVGLFRWLLGWFTFYIVVRAARAAESKYGGFTRERGPTRATALAFLCGLVFCAQVTLGYFEVPTSLKQIANPRYYAAVELFYAAKALRK